MSYSFSVRAATKAEVSKSVAAELDKIVAMQPIHAKDQAQAKAAVDAFVAILPDDTGGKEFSVSVNGSAGWSGLDKDAVVTGVGFNVSASLQ